MKARTLSKDDSIPKLNELNKRKQHRNSRDTDSTIIPKRPCITRTTYGKVHKMLNPVQVDCKCPRCGKIHKVWMGSRPIVMPRIYHPHCREALTGYDI